MEQTSQASASQAVQFPRLNGTVEEREGLVLISNESLEISVSTQALGNKSICEILRLCDGQKTIAEIASGHDAQEIEGIAQLIDALDKQGFIDDLRPAEGRSGLDVMLEIEDLTNEILYKTLYANIFWKKCRDARSEGDIPINVMRGLVIENYHLLFRESYFDAPVLSYVGNTAVRLAMNSFFAEEYGHDELLLKSLNSTGLSRQDLFDSCPLPQTMGLINALAYWAHNDPVFFFTTLGVLEGKDIKEDSFIAAAERMGLDPQFIGPVKAHSRINLAGEHGNLTRQIFRSIPVIDVETIKRIRAQTHLFIELYDSFFTAIWDHYSQTDSLLRRVSTL